MNRSQFLRNLLGAMATLPLANSVWAKPATDPQTKMVIPPYLQPGDTIGITCPASPLGLKELMHCINALKAWGFQVQLGQTIGQHWERFGGTDTNRAADLQAMLNNPSIKAILFARGGYGTMRMMDAVDWSGFQKNPKWLVGYSDITALHCHVQSLLGIPTLHADMANGFEIREDVSSLSLKNALIGKPINYTGPLHSLNRAGQSTGKLVGGNLSLIVSLLGSKSALQTEGKILLIEEVSEYKYTLDRMMTTLRRSGALDNIAGLIIGGLTATKPDGEEPFPMSVEEIVFEKVANKNYPVCFNFSAGHIKNNLALKLGVPYQFSVTGTSVSLSEGQPLPAPVSIPIVTDSVQVQA
ncbi:MAG TPA: LD-carboxypeptidase [Phnomibacter sp.]|nr:LD-carboxypeptidase [Phnomibacter sp.]